MGTVIATDRRGIVVVVGIGLAAATTGIAGRRRPQGRDDREQGEIKAETKDATTSLAGRRSTQGREGRDEAMEEREGCLEAQGREGRDEGLEEREGCLEAKAEKDDRKTSKYKKDA